MKLFVHQLTIVVCVFVVILLSLSCGEQAGSDNEPVEGRSSITFRIAPPGSGSEETLTRVASLNCDELRIDSVSALVYGSTDILLKEGGPWDCELGEGIIENVPSGQTARVVIICHDEDDYMCYRGESVDIVLETDQVADAGVIYTNQFVPQLLSPSSGASVNIASVDLVWGRIASAHSYQVRISETEDFSDAIVIDQFVSTPSFTISESSSDVELISGNTYYWEVCAIDSYGNISAGSSTWNFSTIIFNPTGANNPPIPLIELPENDSVFDEGESIPFQGSANDAEDGVLSGGSLAWTSSLDGQIGIGNSFEKDSLSVGTHKITLRATDSGGAFQTATVAIAVRSIHVNQPP